MNSYTRRRRIVAMVVLFATIILGLFASGTIKPYEVPKQSNVISTNVTSPVIDSLNLLAIKGRAPKTDYSRAQFGDGWETVDGCDTRNIILYRDLEDTIIDSSCNVTQGVLEDTYTGKIIKFIRGSGTSTAIQIDHVVALSNAWQTGAQQLTKEKRVMLANDPLELLAVDGSANQQKSDGDAATWLPPNKPFRCQYIARQIAVKQKYDLWVTQAESDAMRSILTTCPNQQLPIK